jgi:hypothetical protein
MRVESQRRESRRFPRDDRRQGGTPRSMGLMTFDPGRRRGDD